MRQSLSILFAAGLLGAVASSALADDTTPAPQKLTPVKPIRAQAAAQIPKGGIKEVPIDSASTVPVSSTPAAPTTPASVSASPNAATPPAVPGVAVAAPQAVPSCLPEIAKAERRYNIPDGLLVSIALTESGRRDEDSGVFAPWPWTINTHGQGAYFDTVDAAAAKTAELLSRDDGLVDVGCMQVDLYHHPHAFQTILAAFDPETNVDYAARFLTDLKAKNGTWISAVAAYNAGDPALGAEYVARVLYYWKELGTTDATAQVAPNGSHPRRGYVIDAKPSPLEIAAGFVAQKDYAAAVAIYRAVLRNDPDDQTAMFGLAQTLRATGRDDEARQQLERVLTENQSNHQALAALLSIIDEMPAPQRLIALLSARQVAPASAQLPARIAMLEEARGNKSDAIAEMGSAVRLAPGDPVLQLNYALLLDRGGFRNASVAAYTQFLQIYQPGDAVVLTVSLDQVRRRLNYLRSSAQ